MLIDFLRNPLLNWYLNFFKINKILKINKKNNLIIDFSSKINNVTFGLNNKIYRNVTLSNVTLNDFTYVAYDTRISNTRIGKFCSIASSCKIGLGIHPTKEFISTHPCFYSTSNQASNTFSKKSFFIETKEINIGNDVWIGANVIILDGIEIGDGSIIAANSVVTKNVEPYSIVGGVPSKFIKFRFSEEIIKILLELKWWDFNIDFLEKNYTLFHNIDNISEIIKILKEEK